MGTCLLGWCWSWIESNPINQMVLMLSLDHGAVFIDMVGTIEMQNQFLGMSSGLLLSLKQDYSMKFNWIWRSIIAVWTVTWGKFHCNLWGNGLLVGREEDRLKAAEVSAKAAVNDLAMIAMLIPMPRSLHDIWQEFHHGVGGSKAARLFSHRPPHPCCCPHHSAHESICHLP